METVIVASPPEITLTDPTNSGKDVQAQLTSDSLQQATSELRTLLERFANGMSLGVIGEAMRVLYDDAQKDDELKNWFRSVDGYTRKVCVSYLRNSVCVTHGL